MRFLRSTCLATCLTSVLLLTPFTAAHAEGQQFTVGAGWFDFNRDSDQAANFLGEYRGSTFFYGLRPVLGVQMNTDKGFLGYGGFDYDWEFIPHFVLIPGLAAGYWNHGDSINLGGPFEFHESMELDYKTDTDYRVGASISHTSNAHIYDHNPGANQLMATFSVPFGY